MATQALSIDEQVQAFRRTLRAQQPDMDTWTLDQRAHEEEKRLIRESPPVKALQAGADERRREVEAAERERTAAFERGQAERAAEQEASDKMQARAAWIRSGGAPAAFEHEWPALHRRLVADRTIEAMDRQQAQLRERVRRAF